MYIYIPCHWHIYFMDTHSTADSLPAYTDRGQGQRAAPEPTTINNKQLVPTGSLHTGPQRKTKGGDSGGWCWRQPEEGHRQCPSLPRCQDLIITML